MRNRLNWLVHHGFFRGVARFGVHLGDTQSRLVADPMVLANPGPFADELRAKGPVVSSYGTHLVVDYRLAHEVLRSEEFTVFSAGANLPAPLRWLESRTRADLLHPLLPPSMLAIEPPDHTRYRKAVSSVFTPKAVAELRNHVEETAAALLDKLASQPGVINIMNRYCAQLPVAVICDVLGVPARDQRRVQEFVELLAPCLDFGLTWAQYQKMQRGLEGLHFWLTDHLEKLRFRPGNDLMSQLIHTAGDDDGGTGHLNDVEVRMIAALLLAAGVETTVNLLGNGIHLLLDAPEQRDTLSQRPQLWSAAVEEILRLEPPVQLAARTARANIELATTAIERGQLVVIYVAAANRDPSVFANPHHFDIGRTNANRHLSFSTGRHFCLGSALARAEGEVGLKMFFDRFPDARAAGAGRRQDTRSLRGWSHLPVHLGLSQGMTTR